MWSRLMEIFLLLAYVFIVCRHIPLELYRFFALTICWCKRCYMSFWCQQNVDAKDFIWVFGVNKMLTQKILYESLASTKCWRKRCYISFWYQHNVDGKRCYIRFGINKRLTLKVISCRKKVLFFTSTHSWCNDFKR